MEVVFLAFLMFICGLVFAVFVAVAVTYAVDGPSGTATLPPWVETLAQWGALPRPAPVKCVADDTAVLERVEDEHVGRHRREVLQDDPEWRARWAAHPTQGWPTLATTSSAIEILDTRPDICGARPTHPEEHELPLLTWRPDVKEPGDRPLELLDI